VTVQAPPHLQAVLLIHERHPVDGAVARRAADPLRHVDAVVEVHEIGQVVDPRPLERAVFTETGANRLEDRGVGPDPRVAVHAGLGRRNIGERRLLHRRMTVAAVDAHGADVMRMAELHGLIAGQALAGHVAGPRDRDYDPAEEGDKDQQTQDAQPGIDIRGAGKYLTHRLVIRTVRNSKSYIELSLSRTRTVSGTARLGRL